jgi:hypothetical protein
MGCSKRLWIAFFLAITPAVAHGQRCTKGKPCGNTCIAANRTCRVGSGTATKAGRTEPDRPKTKTKANESELSDTVQRLLYGRPRPDSLDAMTKTYLPAVSPSRNASTNDTLFVGSRVDGVFFLRTCIAAQDLAPENRRYFKTEKEAVDAKYRRSRTPSC